MPTPLEPALAALCASLRAERPADRDAIPAAVHRELTDALLTQLAGPPPPCGHVQDLEVPGGAGPRPARLYRPAGDREAWPTLLFFHGGGYVLGNLDTHDVLARHLAEAAGCQVVSVAYRLAPEDPYPAGHEDARAAARWLAAGGGELPVDPARLAVFGDSAGGNLALAACKQLRAAGARPRLRVLAYPAVDARGRTASHRTHADDGFLSSEATAWFLGQLLASGGDPTSPELSPVLDPELGDSPPTFLVLAEYDPLVDDGRAFAHALEAAGAPVELREYPDQTHGFLGMQAVTARAGEALDACAAALREALGS